MKLDKSCDNLNNVIIIICEKNKNNKIYINIYIIVLDTIYNIYNNLYIIILLYNIYNI